MGTRSRMRKDMSYYHQKKKILSKRKPRGSTGTISELEMLWRGLKFPTLAEDEKYIYQVDGCNKYCIYCKKGKAKKILACRQSSCANFLERCEIKKIEKVKEDAGLAQSVEL